jgi:putative transposase
MPSGLKRYYGREHLHFLTFSCYRRRPLLGTIRARDVFVQELSKVRSEMEFQLIGYVVMPEHVHLLVSEPKKGTPSNALQKLKQRVSRKMHRRSKSSLPAQMGFDDGEGNTMPFWQRRFYDFNVYSEGKKKEKLHYMHANPVIRGLVKHPKEWPWSSWSFYAKNETGLIGMDVSV